jgi:hypothetical protein
VNLDILFTKGQSEAADPKVLPNGVFSSLVNMRYRKDGRLGVRNGYRVDASISTSYLPNVVASATVGPKATLSLVQRTSASAAPLYVSHYGASNREVGSSGPGYHRGGDLGVFERIVADNKYFNSGIVEYDATTAPACSDMLYFKGTLYIVSAGYQPGTNTIAGQAYQLSYAYECPGADVQQCVIDSVASNVKLVVINNTVCIFYANSGTNQVRFSVFGSGVSSTVVSTSTGARAQYFDVSPGGSSTEAYLFFQNTASQCTFGTVNSSGTFSALNTITLINSEGRLGITPTFNAPTDQILLAWNDGTALTDGVLRYAVYRRSTSSFLSAATTIYSAQAMRGYPCVAQHPSFDWVIAATFQENNVPIGLAAGMVISLGNAPASVQLWSNFSPVSKPFTAGSGCYVVACDKDLDFVNPATYYVCDVSNINRIEAVFANNGARVADTGFHKSDPRRHVVNAPSLATDPGVAALLVALPLVSPTGGLGVWRCDYGPRINGRLFGSLNGQTFMTGHVATYDGVDMIDDNFAGIPMAVAADAGAGGTLSAGSYQWVATWEYVDALGYRHRSEPSLPFTLSLAASHSATVTVTIMQDQCKVLLGASIHVYRTLVTGTVFYEVGNTSQIAGPITTFTDNTSDATLATHRILYTQGARGGLSGIHENNEPPDARFIAAGSDRVLLGGLEDPTAVQWSKLRFAGEPIAWASDPEWNASVDGAVTAVAEMDGTWFIFTRDTVWTVSGDGPDDNGGGGSFNSPIRQPSDAGCASAKSMLKVGAGLLYLSSRGFELMARGGAASQWVGQAVRDTLAAFPYCSAAAFNQAEQVCYWAVCDAAASAGRLIVYDLRINEWYVDNFYSRAIKALSIDNGALVIDGGIIETAAFTDDDTGAKTTAIIPTIVTGDVRPFGVVGYGRIKKSLLLGEARDVTVDWTLTQDVSYDSGKTFAETATWAIANLAVAIGDAIDGAEHAFVLQRVDNVRLRWSWTTPTPTEGMIFNGFSLEVMPAEGLKRQPPATRAA